MVISVTQENELPALLEWKKAKALLRVLGTTEPSATSLTDADLDGPNYTERDRVQALLAILNEGKQQMSGERHEALSAFLAERVAIREREAAAWQTREQQAELGGYKARRLPHRTAALSIAAEGLPPLLNGRVHKSMHFENAGAAKTVKGRLKDGTAVNVTLQGSGGELTVTERVRCDSPETELNYALALVLDSKRKFGVALCRCHKPGCGRFWLLPDSRGAGKPGRVYCPIHAKERIKLSQTERKRRERSRAKLARASRSKK